MLDYDYIVSALMSKVSYAAIASRESERLCRDVTRNTIAGIHRDLKQGRLSVTNAIKARSAHLPTLLNRPEYVYGKERPIAGGIPVFTGHLTLDLDRVMIWNDLHGTKVDAKFLYQTREVRKYYGIKHLIIAGDIGDNGAISKHRRRSIKLEANLADEIEIISDILDFAVEDEGYEGVAILPGNHDLWLIEALDGAVAFSHVMRSMARTDNVRKRLLITDYDRVTLNSGNRTWTIPHQVGYSSIPLVIAQKMSERFETDIYTTHQHISAGPIKSRNGKHVLMDVGGLFDPNKLQYSQMHTFPNPREMEQGFGTIIEGVGTVWTPERLTTDWSKLLR